MLSLICSTDAEFFKSLGYASGQLRGVKVAELEEGDSKHFAIAMVFNSGDGVRKIEEGDTFVKDGTFSIAYNTEKNIKINVERRIRQKGYEGGLQYEFAEWLMSECRSKLSLPYKTPVVVESETTIVIAGNTDLHMAIPLTLRPTDSGYKIIVNGERDTNISMEKISFGKDNVFGFESGYNTHNHQTVIPLPSPSLFKALSATYGYGLYLQEAVTRTTVDEAHRFTGDGMAYLFDGNGRPVRGFQNTISFVNQREGINFYLAKLGSSTVGIDNVSYNLNFICEVQWFDA